MMVSIKKEKATVFKPAALFLCPLTQSYQLDRPYAGRFRPKVLLRLDVIDWILGSGAPALEKCCQQIDGEHDDQGEQQWH